MLLQRLVGNLLQTQIIPKASTNSNLKRYLHVQPINFNEICFKNQGIKPPLNPQKSAGILIKNPQKSAGFFTRMNPQKSACQVFDLLFRDITPEDYETLLRLDESVSRWKMLVP